MTNVTKGNIYPIFSFSVSTFSILIKVYFKLTSFRKIKNSHKYPANINF